MIRVSKWPGLVTSASPYILPAGGAVEQVNAQSAVPGQLSVRGGMKVVEPTAVEPNVEVTGELLEIWGYSPGSGASEKIFAFTSEGYPLVLTNPTVS